MSETHFLAQESAILPLHGFKANLFAQIVIRQSSAIRGNPSRSLLEIPTGRSGALR
jgi:hypothetical protein